MLSALEEVPQRCVPHMMDMGIGGLGYRVPRLCVLTLCCLGYMSYLRVVSRVLLLWGSLFVGIMMPGPVLCHPAVCHFYPTS